MVVGTDQQEEGKERDIKKKKKKEGVMGGRGGGGGGLEGEREGKSESKLKKEGYSYRGTPQASNSGGYMNSLSPSLSLSLFCFSSLCPHFIPPSLSG